MLAQCLSWPARTGTWAPHGFTHLGTQRGQHYLAGPPLELDALELACSSMLAGHQRGLVHVQHAPTVQCCLPLAACTHSATLPTTCSMHLQCHAGRPQKGADAPATCTHSASPTPLGPSPHLPSNRAAQASLGGRHHTLLVAILPTLLHQHPAAQWGKGPEPCTANPCALQGGGC